MTPLKNKKTEFKKIALGIILSVCVGFVLWTYLLATFGAYEVNGGVASALIYTVIGAYASYALASFGEKNSRNKYGVDREGMKTEYPSEYTEKTAEDPTESAGEKGDG